MELTDVICHIPSFHDVILSWFQNSEDIAQKKQPIFLPSQIFFNDREDRQTCIHKTFPVKQIDFDKEKGVQEKNLASHDGVVSGQGTDFGIIPTENNQHISFYVFPTERTW